MNNCKKILFALMLCVSGASATRGPIVEPHARAQIEQYLSRLGVVDLQAAEPNGTVYVTTHRDSKRFRAIDKGGRPVFTGAYLSARTQDEDPNSFPRTSSFETDLSQFLLHTLEYAIAKRETPDSLMFSCLGFPYPEIEGKLFHLSSPVVNLEFPNTDPAAINLHVLPVLKRFDKYSRIGGLSFTAEDRYDSFSFRRDVPLHLTSGKESLAEALATAMGTAIGLIEPTTSA